QEPLADAAQMADAAVHARAENEQHDDEARQQRAVAEAHVRQEVERESHDIHTWADTRVVQRVAGRRVARSQRTGPSLSGSWRTTGPSSSRSARTITGDGPTSVKSAPTGVAPSEA